MRNFIKLSRIGESFNHMLIDVDLIDYIIDAPGLELGAFVYLKGKPEPLEVNENVDSIYTIILHQQKEQEKSTHSPLSWSLRK